MNLILREITPDCPNKEMLLPSTLPISTDKITISQHHFFVLLMPFTANAIIC